MLSWTGVGLFLLITLFAPSFHWPGWVSDLSPISWVPMQPLEPWTAGSALGLLAVAPVLLAVGFDSFRRRDLALG